MERCICHKLSFHVTIAVSELDRHSITWTAFRILSILEPLHAHQIVAFTLLDRLSFHNPKNSQTPAPHSWHEQPLTALSPNTRTHYFTTVADVSMPEYSRTHSHIICCPTPQKWHLPVGAHPWGAIPNVLTQYVWALEMML